MRTLHYVLILLSTALMSPTQAADKAKIVFISGAPSHTRMAHEHRAGNMILARTLNESGLNVNAVLVPHAGYPEDTSILDDAATIVIFCTGHAGHVLNKHLAIYRSWLPHGGPPESPSKCTPLIEEA